MKFYLPFTLPVDPRQLVWIVLAGLLFAGPARAQEEPVVTIEPAKPKAGDDVTVTYHADAPEATLGEAEAVMWMPGPGSDLGVVPAVMERDRAAWTHTFTVDSSASYGSFYFQAGLEKDDRGGRHWDLLVYDESGVTVEGAHLRRALTLRSRVDDPERLPAMVAEAYRDELAAHPENFVARVRLYAHELRQPGVDASVVRAKAIQAVEEKQVEGVADPATLKRVEWAYNLLGKPERAEAVRQQAAVIDPDDSADERTLLRRAMEETNKARQRHLLEGYLDAYPSSPNARLVYRDLFHLHAASGEAEEALAAAAAFIEQEERFKAGTHSQVARTLAEHDLALEQAEAYAKEALRLAPEAPVGPVRFSGGVWEEEPVDPDVRAQRRAEMEGDFLATLGYVYLKQGRQDEALRTLEQATEKAPRNISAFYTLADVYEQAGEHAKAYAAYQALLREAPREEDAREGMRRTYAAVHGSESGFKAALADVEAQARKAKIERMQAERLDRPAPDVTLTRLDSTSVRLADLTGKVVVMDFWATWCGPCLIAFPHLQKVYERYADHPDVRFLVVNTGQGNTIEDAQAFIEENEQYTFPVVYDEGQAATDAFEIGGIPTTILVDGQGRVQFRRMGFGEAFEEDLALQIEMLLEDRPDADR